jgi:oligoribonuclease NrnB/cAMP/cGMP phosphodiesterase (DHH superfamily)
MRTYVLFHAGCWDGLVAAWVARKHFERENMGRKPAIFVPVHYDQPAPEVEPGSRLYVLDFCFPLEQMLVYHESALQLVLIDHHKSHADVAREMAERYAERALTTIVRFDLRKAGCRLTWEWLFHNQVAPGVVDYAEDRDLWAWKLPGSREVNACLRSFPMEFTTLDKWGQLTYQQLYMEMFSSGEAILRREKQIVDAHVHHAVPTRIGGHAVMAVNATTLVSEIAGELAKGRPFGACFFQDENGKIIWSLRSDEDGLDVSEVAKKFGGGGHPHAAGFTTVNHALGLVQEEKEQQ